MKDILVIGGFAILVGGCSWLYPPLGCIVAGALMLVAGVASHIWGQRK
jgi:hypothetical protein